jgi:hypothetical protein
MHTLRALAVATTAAGLLTGLPLSNALACDNDRFPCPIVSDAPDTTEAPAKAAPAATARKKATQAAPRQDERATHQDEKARPKTEREASRAPARAKPAKPEVQEQATDSGAVAAPVAQAPAPVEPNGNPAPAWEAQPSVAPATSNVGAQIAGPAEAIAPALASPVATVDPNEVNELDLAAASTPAPGPGESSWIKYLLATLGAALAAASTVRFLFV